MKSASGEAIDAPVDGEYASGVSMLGTNLSCCRQGTGGFVKQVGIPFHNRVEAQVIATIDRHRAIRNAPRGDTPARVRVVRRSDGTIPSVTPRLAYEPPPAATVRAGTVRIVPIRRPLRKPRP